MDASLPSHDHLGPPSRAEMPSTTGSISLHNLNGEIEFLESSLQKFPNSPEIAPKLVPKLRTRSQFLGLIADAEQASTLAEDLVRLDPDSASSYAVRATTRAGMHLFTAALADLAEAEKRLPIRAKLRRQMRASILNTRASILEGQGDLDGALAVRRAASEADPNIVNLALEASLVGEMGRKDEAIELFAQARASYHDVDTFNVAWFLLQEGLFWERAGETARARAFYAEAHERLPAYGAAASHLATLVPPERGIELLAPIVATSDDPEFEMTLASRLRAAGKAAEADVHLARVRARYAELVEKHPEGYAEQAGWFLLDDGKDAEKALALAKVNLGVRKNDKAYRLALLAALAAGKRDEACALAAEAVKLPYASEMLRGVAADACKPATPGF